MSCVLICEYAVPSCLRGKMIVFCKVYAGKKAMQGGIDESGFPRAQESFITDSAISTQKNMTEMAQEFFTRSDAFASERVKVLISH